MKRYDVAITIHNTVSVLADDVEQAEDYARDIDIFKTLDGAEYEYEATEEYNTDA